LPSHKVEVLVTLIGSGFMITAHRMNHIFCRQCSCTLIRGTDSDCARESTREV
jgi:hypothetical protein